METIKETLRETSRSDHSTKHIEDPKGEKYHLILKQPIKSRSILPKNAFLFKIGVFFIGVAALIPNAVILSDMDYIIINVMNFY